MKKLCDRFRSKDGSYDCIVPGSGGKDTGFTAHLMKYKYNMHPLTVTWSPHIYTEIGFKNFHSWIDSGFDNVLFTPNGKVHRLLTRLAFKNLLHPFQPFIIGQKTIAPKFAKMFNVKLIIYGENPSEYGGDIKSNYNPQMDLKFFYEKDINKVMLGGVSVKELVSKYKLNLNDLHPYLPLKEELKDVEVHYLSYYHKWNPQEIYYYASKNTGFQPNTERTEGTYSKYSSIDDQSDPYHYYTTLIKFGIGRASYDAAQEIRNKKITRDDGIKLVKKFDEEFPTKYFKNFLDYISMTEKEFWKTIDKFRSPHLWKKEKGVWKLRHTIY